jgi:hypothetical protein
MKVADESGDDVAVFGVVVVVWAIQVGKHDAAVVNAVAGAATFLIYWCL